MVGRAHRRRSLHWRGGAGPRRPNARGDPGGAPLRRTPGASYVDEGQCGSSSSTMGTPVRPGPRYHARASCLETTTPTQPRSPFAAVPPWPRGALISAEGPRPTSSSWSAMRWVGAIYWARRWSSAVVRRVPSRSSTMVSREPTAGSLARIWAPTRSKISAAATGPTSTGFGSPRAPCSSATRSRWGPRRSSCSPVAIASRTSGSRPKSSRHSASSPEGSPTTSTTCWGWCWPTSPTCSASTASTRG